MSEHLNCARGCLRWVAAWTVVFGALQLMAPVPASACTCLFGGTGVLWPQDGSSVSADTAIVIEALGLSLSAAPGAATLRGPDGNEIKLKAIQRIPRTHSCDRDIVFLKPEPDLTPGTEYEFALKIAAETEQRLKFAAHASSRRPSAASTPDVTYLFVGEHPDCEEREGQCFDLAEVRVELEHALPEPTWLVIRSGAGRSPVNRWELSSSFRIPIGDPGEIPVAPERLAQLSVPLPPQDTCVDIAIYGIDGQPAFEERRCKPDRCALHKARNSSTCGEPPRSGLDPTRLSPASCDDPPVLGYGANFAYPEFDAGAQARTAERDEDEAARQRKRPAPSCHAQQPSAANSLPWPAATVAFAFLLMLRRRRR